MRKIAGAGRQKCDLKTERVCLLFLMVFGLTACTTIAEQSPTKGVEYTRMLLPDILPAGRAAGFASMPVFVSYGGDRLISGTCVTPALADLDRDGDLDLVMTGLMKCTHSSLT